MTEQAPVRMTYLVKEAELVIRSGIDRIVRRLGLTTPQYTALSVLERHPGISSAQLARRSFVTSQAANEMVAVLERKGFVRRRVDAANRRVLEMYLTEEGQAVLRACDDQVDGLEARMVSDLDDGQRREMRRALESCVRSLSAPLANKAAK